MRQSPQPTQRLMRTVGAISRLEPYNMKIATQNIQKKRQPGKNWHLLPPSIILPLLGGLLLAVILLAVSFASTPIPISTIVKILLTGTGIFHFARQWDPANELIVWQVRMPGVVGAALVATGLAVAGVLFQAR